MKLLHFHIRLLQLLMQRRDNDQRHRQLGESSHWTPEVPIVIEEHFRIRREIDELLQTVHSPSGR